MPQLAYSFDELYTSHDYAASHLVAGRTIHGGYDESGKYVSPRALLREQAISNWTEALQLRGGDWLFADSSLLNGPRMPNVEQHRFLLNHGLGRTLWNGLTITAKLEARGRMLAEVEFPNLQKIIAEDISQMALGHLNGGMLSAHGIDEGGDPDKGIGGHDVMWYIARDLLFGDNAFADVEPPESISRPETGQRLMPLIPVEFEGMIGFLMNLLMIEFRAEIGFSLYQEVLRTPGLFACTDEDAALAADIIERVRTDEDIHVRSLRLYLGELRAVTLKTVSGGEGGEVKGAEVIDPYWQGLVQWATVEQPVLAAKMQREFIEPQILALAKDVSAGQQLVAEFDQLADSF